MQTSDMTSDEGRGRDDEWCGARAHGKRRGAQVRGTHAGSLGYV